MLVDGDSVGPVTSYTFSNVTANHTISATFTSEVFTITPTAGANGSITPATAQTVNYGANRAFTIAPATGYHIAQVRVDGDPVGPVTSYTFSNVTANHTISATFAIDTFTITPTAGAHGSITPATAQTVDYGDDPAFTITPDTGYHVADVEVDGVSVGARTSFTFSGVDDDHTISATFAIDTFSITASAGAHGTISPSTTQTVEYGGNQAFTIKASAGYYIADVRVDGASVGPMTSYTFSNVAANHAISASFAQGLQTELWISAGKVVTFGASTVLRGELSDASDPLNRVGLGGRSVIVEAASSPTAPPSQWQSLGTFTTSSEAGTLGQVTVPISPTSPTYYRLRYVAQPTSPYGGTISVAWKVGVRPLLGRPVVPTSARAGRFFTVYGSLRPHFTAGEKTVHVKVYRYKHGRWVYVKTMAATNVDNGSFTRYRLRTRITTRAKYRFRATSTATGWAVATSSASRTLVVR